MLSWSEKPNILFFLVHSKPQLTPVKLHSGLS